MRENASRKAERYLAEGRVIVTFVDHDRVAGTARGDGALYSFAYLGGKWSCECPATTDQCCHLKAARKVTAPDLKPR